LFYFCSDKSIFDEFFEIRLFELWRRIQEAFAHRFAEMQCLIRDDSSQKPGRWQIPHRSAGRSPLVDSP
jgi:hypothetical protein